MPALVRGGGPGEHPAGDVEHHGGRGELGEGKARWDHLGEPGARTGGRGSHVEVGVGHEHACRGRRRTVAGAARGGASARHRGKRRHERVEQITVLHGERRVIRGSHQVKAAPETVLIAQRDA